MAHLVAVITDLELAAELVAAAEAAGHDVDVCTDEPDAWEACESALNCSSSTSAAIRSTA
jgi:hypothetical protein